MAAPTDIELARTLADVTEAQFADDYVQNLIDRAGSYYGATAILWQIKAAGYAKAVAAASGSTRIELNQKFEHARAMMDHFSDSAGGLADTGTWLEVEMAKAYDEDQSEYTWPLAGEWPAWAP